MASEPSNKPLNQKRKGRLRDVLDFSFILATISIVVLVEQAIWLILPILVIYMIILERDSKPYPIIVKRWNKKAGKYIYYEMDKKTGEYIKKSDNQFKEFVNDIEKWNNEKKKQENE